MSQPLRVLIVEDSESDVLLMLRVLRKAGFEPEYHRVDNPGDIRAALEERSWDAVISDYDLPQMTGIDVLNIVRQKDLDLPFIIVSGRIGEYTAVATMEAGAHDYIMKDKLSRLGPAIEREIRNARTRQERKVMVGFQAGMVKALHLLDAPTEESEAVRNLVLQIRKFTGIEAVGLRLKEGEDFPYYQTSGFPEKFVQCERYLCARDQTGELIRDLQGRPVLECMCGNVICGRFDPSMPFFTDNGSFWSNSTTEFLSSTTEQERRAARMRSRCNSQGYESVALIPLRTGVETTGLLQLNDRRQNTFTSEMIAFFEGMTAGIVVGFARRAADKERRETKNRPRQGPRMDAVGRLAGRVADDCNRMLTIIAGHGEMALSRLDSLDPLCDDIQEIAASAKRSVELTRQLLASTRK